MSEAIVFLADGCEECEALLVVDLLRRAKVNTITAAVSDTGSREIVSSHGIRITADTTAEKAEYTKADMIVLPGGMPGTVNLANNETVQNQSRIFAETKRVAAICAAPSVLGQLGLLKNKRATCYPGFEDKLIGTETTGEKVTVAGNITTGQALGAAIPFALELIRQLEGNAVAERVSKAICL